MNIIDKHNLLTSSQVELLKKNASEKFRLGRYSSIENILTSLKVDVIVEPGIQIRELPDSLNDAKDFWREEAYRMKEVFHEREEEYENYCEAERKLEEIRNEKELHVNMPLRGLYDPQNNVIKLFPEEMITEYNGLRMDELLVSTLAHETMHAYFNRLQRRKIFPYVYFVEEPLAEFGMLLYLNETNSPFMGWAHQDVKNKKTCYRYGVALFEQYINGDKTLRKYLEDYKVRLEDYNMPIIDRTGGIISMPTSTTVIINGKQIPIRWKEVVRVPPRYFYDKTTKTLGLDGDWMCEYRRKRECIYMDIVIDECHIDFKDIDFIYIGDEFTYLNKFFRQVLSQAPVSVSPKNQKYSAIDGIPFFKCNDVQKPALLECGDGYYAICRNGNWGAIDESLKPVIPCEYNDSFHIERLIRKRFLKDS